MGNTGNAENTVSNDESLLAPPALPTRHSSPLSDVSREGRFIVNGGWADLFSYDLHSLRETATIPASSLPSGRMCLECSRVKKLDSRSVVTSSRYEWSETEDSDDEEEPTHIRVFDLEENRETVFLSIDGQIVGYEPIRHSPEDSGCGSSRRLAAVATYGRVTLHDLDSSEALLSFSESDPTWGVQLLSVAPWNESLFVYANETISSFNVSAGTLLDSTRVNGRASWAGSSGFSPDISTQLLYTHNGSRTISVLDARNGLRVQRRLRASEGVFGLHSASDRSELFVSTSSDGGQRTTGQVSIEVWDIRKLKTDLRRFPLPKPIPSRFSFTSLTRVSYSEFASMCTYPNAALFLWNDKGKCTEHAEIDRFGQGYALNGFCTVGSPFDDDVVMWRQAGWSEVVAREDEEERIGFVVKMMMESGSGSGGGEEEEGGSFPVIRLRIEKSVFVFFRSLM